jgi:hypothetical protein
MNSCLKFPHVLSDIGTTDTGMALGTHEVTQSNNHLLDLLTKNATFTGKYESLYTYVALFNKNENQECQVFQTGV